MKRLVIVILILHVGINSFAQKSMQTEFDSLIGKGREYLYVGKI